MELINFIEKTAFKDNVLGQLSREILSDSDFPFEKSNKEMFEYLDLKMIGLKYNQTYLEFKRAYLQFEH